MCKDGYKGKSKGGKEKSKNPKEDECYICGKRRHFQEDCWYKDTRGEKGKGKVKGKGKQKGKGRDKDKPVTERSQMVGNFTSDWIFALTWAASLEEIYESDVAIPLGQWCIRPRVQPRVRQPQSSSSKVGHWSGSQRRWQRDTDSRDEDEFVFDWRTDR